ncbi:hypothetical protein BH24BAC1_BH24BAC1_38510 [soil metagenome]
MTYLTATEERTLQGVKFALPGPDPKPKICPPAEPFAQVCETLLQEVNVHPSDVRVNLALLTLQAKFFAAYAQAPADCRRHLNSSKVRCIFQLYHETYEKLWTIDLKLRPPRFQEPPAPPPPPTKVVKVYKLDSFPIGHVEEDEDEDDE